MLLNLGGSGSEQAIDIEVDSSNNLYVFGLTTSTDFPTQSPLQSSSGGGFDCFVAKIAATGSWPNITASLTFSTYLGGSGTEEAKDLALDSNNNLYLTGNTASSDFPTENPLQATLSGSSDAFLTVISSDGSQMTYSSYFGGSGDESGRGVAVDSHGVYMMGYTNSTDLTTASPTQLANAGDLDAFLVKFNTDLNQVLFSSYLGGSSSEGSVSALDTSGAMALDNGGDAFLTGSTSSTDFPTASAFQSSKGSGATADAFVTELNITAPGVSSTSPTSGATSVAISDNITVTFNDDIDSATLTSSTFFLDGGITGTVSYDSATKTATLNPSTKLQSSTQYTATLTTDIQDTGDNALASNYTWAFTTAAKISTASSCNLSKDDVFNPLGGIAATELIPNDLSQKQLPLYFIENRGQLNPAIDFYVQDRQHQILFSKQGIDYHFSLKQKFLHSNPHVKIKAHGYAAAKINYLMGNDTSKWLRNIPTATQIVYEDLYPGIDMVLHGTKGNLKSEFVVKAGVDYQQIKIAYEGINGLTLSDQGDLIIRQKNQEMRELAPLSYQIIDGKKIIVPSHYAPQGQGYRFVLGNVDPQYPLVIDPALLYGSYLGGTAGDSIIEMKVDSSGNIYLAGLTASSNFPTTVGAYLTSLPGSISIFVSKMNAQGTALVYSTFLGGTNTDVISGMAVDSNGAVYLTGLPTSTDFPTTLGAFQTSLSGSTECFVTKLNTDGSNLDYSSFFGGSGAELCGDIAVDSSGSAYIVGLTSSSDLPLQNPIDSTLSGINCFVTKFNSTGSGLVYSTYLGGSNLLGAGLFTIETCNDIVVGSTLATDFPLASPLQSSLNNSQTGFLTKINADGSALLFSTYLGGADTDTCTDIVVDADQNIYTLCATQSLDFHTTSGAFQTSNAGAQDMVVIGVRADFSDYLFSTYLGGNGDDTPTDLMADTDGNVFLVGTTASSNFPTGRPYQSSLSGTQDAIIAQINPTGGLEFSTYFGGSASDSLGAIALAPNEAKVVWVGGSSTGTDLPVSSSAFQSSNNGSTDVYFAKIDTDSLRVSSTNPSSDQVQVSIDSNIRVVFSEGLDSSTLNSTTLSLSPTVSGTLSYDGSNNTATFNPDGLLAISTDYTVILTTGITNATGNPLSANYSFTFTTDPLITQGGTPFCQLNKGVVSSHGFLEIILVTLLGLLLYRGRSLHHHGSRI
ncbi:MAG: SBBP repeat-containing protein [Deltaproteobacteria bacterium]|nr:SBBP repeat-containing protein [Deltaproteobacteria bacterium]